MFYVCAKSHGFILPRTIHTHIGCAKVDPKPKKAILQTPFEGSFQVVFISSVTDLLPLFQAMS